MKLSVISFQNMNEKSGRFSETYEQSFSGSGDEIYVRNVNAMLALIRHLENEVDAPEHWLCTSHLNLWFFGKDLKNYNEVSCNSRKLIVGMSEREQDFYQVGSRTTNAVRIAGEWVRCALEAETQNQRPTIQDQFPNRTSNL